MSNHDTCKIRTDEVENFKALIVAHLVPDSELTPFGRNLRAEFREFIDWAVRKDIEYQVRVVMKDE